LPGGQLWGNTRPAAGGERTLMGPAVQRSRKPKSAYPPMRVHVLKRRNGQKVGKLAYEPAGATDDRKRGSRFQANTAQTAELYWAFLHRCVGPHLQKRLADPQRPRTR
jgi:hypothetical protein